MNEGREVFRLMGNLKRLMHAAWALLVSVAAFSFSNEQFCLLSLGFTHLLTSKRPTQEESIDKSDAATSQSRTSWTLYLVFLFLSCPHFALATLKDGLGWTGMKIMVIWIAV